MLRQIFKQIFIIALVDLNLYIQVLKLLVMCCIFIESGTDSTIRAKSRQNHKLVTGLGAWKRCPQTVDDSLVSPLLL